MPCTQIPRSETGPKLYLALFALVWSDPGTRPQTYLRCIQYMFNIIPYYGSFVKGKDTSEVAEGLLGRWRIYN